MEENSDCESETRNDTIQETFKEAVKSYLMLSEEIGTIKESIKEKNKKMKKLNEFILSYMKQNEKEICNLGDKGTLIRKVKSRKVTFKQTDIEALLAEYFKDENQAKESTSYIFSKQEKKETEVLERSKKVI